MTNAKNRKLLAVLLALALLSLSVMALGGTLASQIDATNNAMEYDVQVSYHRADYNDYGGVLFGENAQSPFSADINWCPGYTKVVYFQVVNNEKFDVNYELILDAGESKLKDVLKYAVRYDLQPNSTDLPSSWSAFAGDNAKQLDAGSHTLSLPPATSTQDENSSDTASIVPNLNSGATDYIALAIHMDENANNDYQGKSMNLDFKLIVKANHEPGYNPATDTTTPD